MSNAEIAARHRAVAANFTRLVDGVTDWDAPTPVPEWRARDIVMHLTTWLAGLFRDAGFDWPDPPSATDDPVRSWHHQVELVQDVLDDPITASMVLQHPHLPPGQSLAQSLDLIYVSDVFMHSWDLARSSGQEHLLDEAVCAETLAGMEQIEPVLRDSGFFGTRQAVADNAPASERLMAFIGRDPHWQPPGC